MATQAPLSGIRVVDLADEKGELAGRLLADCGAEVVRVEPPDGARSRRLPPFRDEARASDSLYFAFRNTGKWGLALDLEAAADRVRLLDLLARADVLIESESPGRMASLGLAPETLCERFPHLVVLSISDFGQTGPYRDWVGSDGTLSALAGMQCKAGLPDREPLLSPASMAYDIAGILGAWAALAALYQRERTRFGQAIDLSVLEAVAGQTDWALANASMVEAKGGDSFATRVGSGPVYKIFPCKGGFVRLVIMAPRQWHAMREWLGNPDYLQDPKYDSFLGRLEIADALNVMIGDLFETMTHEEVSFEAQKRGIVCTPVLKPAEVLANEHFVSRETFRDFEIVPGQTGPFASGFGELDRNRLGLRSRAPLLDEHRDRVFERWPDKRPRPAGPRPAPSRPFEGLRVLDFGIGGVGVEAARLFADYGADVIKVESRSYPDFIRVIMSSEMSASFASSNRSKRGLGLNLKSDEGRRMIRELMQHADVVTENGSTGMMEGLGLGYETLRSWNPGIVLASSQLLGSRGAWSDWIGYGPSTQPIGGLVHLWDYADDGPPAGSTSIFPDHTAGRVLSFVALVALFRRLRTGHGGHAEVAQAEVVANVLGDRLLQEGVSPGSVGPMGNRNLRGAPWGAYPCLGNDQWVAITVRDDADWRKLKTAMGEPEWASDPSYDTAAGRRAAHDAIDEALRGWTSNQAKRAVVATCQMFGVPAGAMLLPSEQMGDPHFLARDYPRWVDQQGLGWIAFEGPPFRASGMKDIFMCQAPWLGEHTREIARELLALDPEEVDRFVEDGVLEVTEPG